MLNLGGDCSPAARNGAERGRERDRTVKKGDEAP